MIHFLTLIYYSTKYIKEKITEDSSMPIGNPVTLTSNVASKTISVTATASQTLFNVTGGYRINSLGVFKNGLRLQDGVDYTARDGLTVTLLSAASGGDKLQFVVFDTFSVAEAIRPNVDEQTIRGNLNVVGILSASTLEGLSNFNLTSGITTFNDVRVGGALTVAGALTFEDVTNIDSVGYATFRSGINVQGAGSTTTTLNVTGVSTFGGGVDVNTIRGATNNSNVAFGARASNGAHVISLILKPDRSATFDGGVGIADSIFHIGDDNTAIRFPLADTFTVETAGAERLRIASDGKIGINTTVLTEQLEVDGDIRVRNAVKFRDDNGDETGNISMGDDDNFTIQSFGTSGHITFDTGSGVTERLRITSAGRVGVGTADPSFNMTVAGSSNPRLEIEALDNSTAGLFINTKSGGAIVAQSTIRTDNDGRLQIFVGRTSESLRFQLDEAGNVNASGITTATQLYEGTNRVATAGKAVAMALVFG